MSDILNFIDSFFILGIMVTFCLFCCVLSTHKKEIWEILLGDFEIERDNKIDD